MSLVIVLILFMISTFVVCHSSLVEKLYAIISLFFMEFPVAYIERPRLYDDRVTFLVRWEDRSVTEEEVSNFFSIFF